MGRKQPSVQQLHDLIWVCRRLAAALQGETTILQALDSVLGDAPIGPAHLLQAMKTNLLCDGTVGRGLVSLVPSFVWGAILSGELRGALGDALIAVADRLETEESLGPKGCDALHHYSLAFGRLALQLQLRAPLLQALEAAAESLPAPEVGEILFAAAEGVRAGADLSEALSRVAADLPPSAFEMIRNGEQAGNLPISLSIVSDYLLDEARARKEAKNA